MFFCLRICVYVVSTTLCTAFLYETRAHFRIEEFQKIKKVLEMRFGFLFAFTARSNAFTMRVK